MVQDKEKINNINQIIDGYIEENNIKSNETDPLNKIQIETFIQTLYPNINYKIENNVLNLYEEFLPNKLNIIYSCRVIDIKSYKQLFEIMNVYNENK